MSRHQAKGPNFIDVIYDDMEKIVGIPGPPGPEGPPGNIEEITPIIDAAITAHKNEGDPHWQYATHAEVVAKIAEHEDPNLTPDPHPQYVTQPELDPQLALKADKARLFTAGNGLGGGGSLAGDRTFDINVLPATPGGQTPYYGDAEAGELDISADYLRINRAVVDEWYPDKTDVYAKLGLLDERTDVVFNGNLSYCGVIDMSVFGGRIAALSLLGASFGGYTVGQTLPPAAVWNARHYFIVQTGGPTNDGDGIFDGDDQTDDYVPPQANYVLGDWIVSNGAGNAQPGGPALFTRGVEHGASTYTDNPSGWIHMPYNSRYAVATSIVLTAPPAGATADVDTVQEAIDWLNANKAALHHTHDDRYLTIDNPSARGAFFLAGTLNMQAPNGNGLFIQPWPDDSAAVSIFPIVGGQGRSEYRLLFSGNRWVFDSPVRVQKDLMQYNAATKSWLHHINSNGDYMLVPSQSPGGEDWGWGGRGEIVFTHTGENRIHGNLELLAAENAGNDLPYLRFHKTNVGHAAIRLADDTSALEVTAGWDGGLRPLRTSWPNTDLEVTPREYVWTYFLPKTNPEAIGYIGLNGRVLRVRQDGFAGVELARADDKSRWTISKDWAEERFIIHRFDDAGSYAGAPLIIDRGTGWTTLDGGLTVNNGTTILNSGLTVQGAAVVRNPQADGEAATKWSAAALFATEQWAAAGDWNTMTTPGTYKNLVLGSDPNGPDPSHGNYFYCVTYQYGVDTNGGGNCTQVAIPYLTGPGYPGAECMYMRTRYQGTWSPWKTVGARVLVQATAPANPQDGDLWVDTSLPVWHPITNFSNGWGPYGGWQPPQYMKDANGMVHLRGLLSGSNGGTMCTLPAGYRPNAGYIFACQAGGDTARVDVHANGNVDHIASAHGAGHLSLCNISFTAGA